MENEAIIMKTKGTEKGLLEVHAHTTFLAEKLATATNYLLTLATLGLLKPDLDVQQTYLRGGFVEQKLASSFSFKCDQIHNNHCH
jgi:hypothetical protein